MSIEVWKETVVKVGIDGSVVSLTEAQARQLVDSLRGALHFAEPGEPADPAAKAPDCPRCGNNRQVWRDSATGRDVCHGAGCGGQPVDVAAAL